MVEKKVAKDDLMKKPICLLFLQDCDYPTSTKIRRKIISIMKKETGINLIMGDDGKIKKNDILVIGISKFGTAGQDNFALYTYKADSYITANKQMYSSHSFIETEKIIVNPANVNERFLEELSLRHFKEIDIELL